MPSVPAAVGRSRAPRPWGRQGAPGPGRAVTAGEAAAEGLLPGQRADGVGDEAARPGPRQRLSEELALEGGDPPDVRRVEPPAGLGPPAEDPEPRAGRVEEHPVEATRTAGAGRTDREAAAVGDQHLHRVEPEAEGGVADAGRPPGPEVGGHDEPVVAHRLGEGGGLPARSGGHVEDALPGPGGDGGGDGLAGLVLRGRPALGHGREAGEVPDPPHEQGARHEPARLDLHAGGPGVAVAGQFVGEGLGGGPQGVGAERDAGGGVGGGEDGVGVGPEVAAEELDDPATASGSSPAGQGQSGPRSATRRRTALAYGTALRTAAGHDGRASAPTVALTAAWGATPDRSW